MDSRDAQASEAQANRSVGGALASGPVERLAAECVARLGSGEALDVEAVAAQLTEAGDRERLRRLVEDARRLESLLPPQVRSGALLKGRYRLLREIGSGGMGKVFEALDIQLERRVAVKVLAVIGASSFDPEQLFMQEAVLLASLQHPNIVAVHELGVDGDVTFIVMDLVEGVGASAVLERVATALAARKGGPPRRGSLLTEAIGLSLPAGRASQIEADSWFRSAARLVLDVTRTIEEAHGKGVVHRDIKPHNILLRGDGSPVILDFGLAGTLDRAQGSISRGLFGTVGYLAPEQASSSAIGADRRTDVYQLGLLLYEFLTLARAFPGDKLSSVLARISRGEFRRPRTIDAGIPFELEAICLQAMELDPARRYATATALREDLQRYLDGSEVPHAARGGVLAAAARSGRYWVRRHKPTVAVAVTAAAALVALQIGSWAAPPAEAVVDAFHYNDNEPRVYYSATSDTAHIGDILGVTIRAAAPQYVYVLSVFGERNPPTFVAPMILTVIGSEEPEAGTEVPWGLRVEPGASLSCTRIGERSRIGSYEGLCIFTSPQPQPRLEEWMRRLGSAAFRSPDKAVRYADAWAAFDTVPSRGEKVEFAPGERARLASSLTAATVLGETEWPFSDPRRQTFFFRVVP